MCETCRIWMRKRLEMISNRSDRGLKNASIDRTNRGSYPFVSIPFEEINMEYQQLTLVNNILK